MAKNSEILSNHLFRGGFYALTVVLGLQLALQQLDQGLYQNFVTIVVVISGIFLIELYSGWVFRGKRSSRFKKMGQAEQAKRVEEFTLHFIIPAGFFYLAAAFIGYNRQVSVRIAFLTGLFFILTLLFVNIRAFYQKQNTLEARTHYIYDVIKILMFFLATNVLFQRWNSGNEVIIPLVASSSFALGLFILSSIRYRKFETRLAGLTLIGALVLFMLLLIAVSFAPFNPLRISAFAVLFYYIIWAFLHHLMHRSLSKTLALEYLVIAGIALILMLGLA